MQKILKPHLQNDCCIGVDVVTHFDGDNCLAHRCPASDGVELIMTMDSAK